MRSGLVASGDSAVREASSSAPAAPASDRLCGAAVVLFALWTVCCHAIVAAGRGLVALLVLYGVALVVSLALRRWWLRAASPTPAHSQGAALGEALPPVPSVLRAAALVAGAAAALSYAVRPDIVQLWWSAVILLGLAAVALCFREAALIALPERSRSSEMLLWLLAASVVVLTLVSHRPDADDAFYMSVAVAAADLPGQALLSVDTMHGIPGLPLYLPVYRVDSYELLNGAVSYLTGIPVIYSFHWLSAGLGALLVPLAHASLFRILTPRRWLATVATLVVVLAAAGETHRWYGNFSFVRMWQGKCVALSVFMPLVYAYALRFGVRPNLRDWAMLAAAQIAAVGCSSSALWLAPAGAVMALCAAVRPSRQGVKAVALGTLASVYVLAAAWLVRAGMVGVMGTSIASFAAAAGEFSPPQLSAALVTVLGNSRLLIFGIASIVTGWVFAPPGLARRVAVVFPLAVLLGLLNPYIANWVAAHVTGPSYWRSMWALPLPILMALMLTSPLHLGGGSPRPGARRATWLVLLAAFALLVPRYSGLSPQNFVRLAWPALKVPDAAYRWAAAVNESVPPGSPVAVASEVDAWVVTFHHHADPVIVRHYLQTTGPQLSNEDLRARYLMRRFLDTPELVEAMPDQFRKSLDRFAVRAVCLVNSPKAGMARTILQQAGFSPTLRPEDYELWVRPEGGEGEPRRRRSTWVR